MCKAAAIIYHNMDTTVVTVLIRSQLIFESSYSTCGQTYTNV